jgi:hypothetical protein
MAGAIALVLITPALAEIIRITGRNIPAANPVTDYGWGLAWAGVLGVSLRWLPIPVAHRKSLLELWILKCFVMLGFMLWYESHYDVLDAYSYAHSGRSTPEWEGLGFGRGTENIIMLVWLQYSLLPDSYHLAKVTFGFLGFLGVYMYAVAAADYLGPQFFRRALFLFGLFPSILFWSSILGKDPVVFFATALYVFGIVRWACRRKMSGLVLAGCGICLAMLIRLWTGALLLLPVFLLIGLRVKGVALRFLLILVASGAMLFATRQFTQQFNIENQESLFATTNALSRGWATGGSGQEVNQQFVGWSSLILFAPLGMFTALFRPLPGEVMNPFGLLSGLENVVLLGLLVLSFKRMSRRDLSDPVILWLCLLVVVWAFCYGFVSYQNLGTAVRFRLQILPALLASLVYLARHRRAGHPAS